MPFGYRSAIMLGMNGKIKKIEYGGITSPAGFSAGAVYVGVKSHKKEKPDVALLISDRPAACAALFTRNTFCGAPIVLGRRIAETGVTRGAVLNSGNANTGTGQAGIDAALAVERFAEDLLGFEKDSLFVSSTGVIGEAFPAGKVIDAVRQIAPLLSESGGHDAARAIMTTDRFPKEYACELTLSGGKVRIGVMAKGSGMIHPDMATVLCFVTTDACLKSQDMRPMLKRACDVSFNALSVDGDTSTNDTLLMMANGASGVAPGSEEDMSIIEYALREMLLDMSLRIAADGEGASKTMKVRVSGAPDDTEAGRIARRVVSSSNVKVALGRGDLSAALVLTAAGAAESSADLSDADCHIETDGDMTVIEIAFGTGSGAAEAFGCDLTTEYIRINGLYRT